MTTFGAMFRPLTDGRFAAALRDAREQANMSQNRLAAEASVDHSHISRLEAGRREPSREMVAVLVTVLSLTGSDAARLFVSAGYLPPDWRTVMGDAWTVWTREEATNGVRPDALSHESRQGGLSRSQVATAVATDGATRRGDRYRASRA